MRTRMRTRRTGRRSRPRRCRRRRLSLSRGSARGRRPRPLPPDSTRPHPSRALVTPAMFFGCVVASFAPGFEPGSRGSASAGLRRLARGEVTRKSPGSYLSAKLLFRRASVLGGGMSSCRDRVLAAVQLESSAPPSTTPSNVSYERFVGKFIVSSAAPDPYRASARARRSCAAAAPHRVGK